MPAGAERRGAQREDQRKPAVGSRQGGAGAHQHPPDCPLPNPDCPPGFARLCFAGLVALARGIKPDPIPNSAVKPLSANGTKPQGLGESVAARPAKHSFREA